MKIWFEEIPTYNRGNIKGNISVLAEGIIELQRRRIVNEEELFNFEDYVGGFNGGKGVNGHGGWTSQSIIESTLVHLNGCKVRVIIEVLEMPIGEKKVD